MHFLFQTNYTIGNEKTLMQNLLSNEFGVNILIIALNYRSITAKSVIYPVILISKNKKKIIKIQIINIKIRIPIKIR